MSTLTKKLGLIALTVAIPFLTFSQQIDDGKLKYTDLSIQEMYLMRFQSICHQISPEDDWDKYLADYEAQHKAPPILAGQAGSYGQVKQASEIELLMANQVPGQVQLAPLAPHFPLQYLYKFYPTEYQKVAPGSSKQAIANEFDIRKNVPIGKKKMVEDAAKLPFGQERYFRGMPMKRSEYDFDNQCFYVQPDFSNIVGFLGMYGGSESVKIPLTFIEEYKAFLSKITIPIPEDKAEKLFSKLDQSSTLRLWPKVVFELVDEPVKEPTYVHYNGYNWWTVFPLKFKVKYIDIELINGFYTSNIELVHRIEELPSPKWEAWAISAGSKQTEGTIGSFSTALSSLQGSATTTTGTTTAPTTSNTASGLIGPETATSKRNFPFMRFYKNRVKEPYVHYVGTAKNLPPSLKPFEKIQLELCYSYYFEPNMNLLRQLRPSLIFGGIYLGVEGQEQYLGQALNEVIYLDDNKGFRFKLGNNPYGKQMKQAGYKGAYFDAVFNQDHSMTFTLYDKNGKVHITSKLQPLDKNAKPPFTNN